MCPFVAQTSDPYVAMPTGPFASSLGVGRAEPEWAAKNKVTEVVGNDPIAASGETSEAPLKLGAEVMSGDLSTAPKKVDLLIAHYPQKRPGKRETINVVDTLGRSHSFRPGGFLNVLAFSLDGLDEAHLRSLHMLPWFDAWQRSITEDDGDYQRERARLAPEATRWAVEYESLLPRPARCGSS